MLVKQDTTVACRGAEPHCIGALPQAELARAAQLADDKEAEAAALNAELRKLKKKLEDLDAERAAAVGANKKLSGERDRLQVGCSPDW